MVEGNAGSPGRRKPEDRKPCFNSYLLRPTENWLNRRPSLPVGRGCQHKCRSGEPSQAGAYYRAAHGRSRLGRSGNHASRKPYPTISGRFIARQTLTCARLSQRVWLSLFTVCIATKISTCRPTLDLARHVSLKSAVETPPYQDHWSSSREWEWCATGH
jgi:hypothetical protein